MIKKLSWILLMLVLWGTPVHAQEITSTGQTTVTARVEMPEESDEGDRVETKDGAWPGGYAALLAASGGVLLFCGKRFYHIKKQSF